MDETEEINRKFEKKRSRVRIAPGPKGKDVPDWLKDGVEDLYEFFNTTAELWDEKFKPGSGPFYEAVADQIASTDAEIQILDLGCGTGLEFEFLLRRAPNARITGVDLAPNMLDQIRTKFSDHMGQIRLIEGNILDFPLGEAGYDYVISTLTMHHLPPDNKVRVYEKIRGALTGKGLYVEGDQSVLQEVEDLRWYRDYISKLPGGDRGQWNFDVTLSVQTQKELLRKAGFSKVSLAWEKRESRYAGLAVLVARS